MRATLVALLVCTTVAHAGPHQVLVLRAEGTADTSTRTTVETHVLRLAKNIEGKIEAGDITYADAAAAAGCNPADVACKDEVLATFAVDELVATTVLSSNAQHTVMVRRMKKGATPKVATSQLIAGAIMDGRLQADIGPLFGIGTAPPAPPAEAEPKKPVATNKPEPTRPPTQTSQLGSQSSTSTPPTETAVPPTESTSTTTAATTTATTTPDPSATGSKTPVPAPVDSGPPSRRLQKVGLITGGAFIVLGVIMWSAAASTQEQIDAAPVNTPEDFANLRQLESDADGQAGLGNLFFVGGLVVGGISGYYYWKKGRQARARTAVVTPTVFPHGGGLVLTFGGGR